jgi:acid phosphatase family membrane protein YuiD
VDELLANSTLRCASVAWLLAQISKLIISLIIERRLRLAYLASSGGMPSSHSALVTALAARIGLEQGVQSPVFALAFVLAAIVMYDAAGVRRAVSVQARILNRMLEEVIEYQRFSEKRLRELLGHTPFEVLVGALLGFATALTV